MSSPDTFTGSWQCDLKGSHLPRAPQSWIQRINVNGDRIEVQEDIVTHDGIPTQVRIQAKFDGREYPVIGSALADSIAYTRQGDVISGRAKKSGAVSLEETIKAEGMQMVANLAIFAGGKQVASGRAVFHKLNER